jgi:rare lipoprotein A
MKRLGVVLIFGLLSVYCFAQSQTGNASYNASKNGFAISHPSMSFGTRVRIINLRNNSEVVATVDGRIPIEASRIADISREAGDAIGMSRSGYTEVRIELLPREQHTTAPEPAQAPTPPTGQGQAQTPAPTPPPPPPQAPPREEIVQNITLPPAQYIPAAPVVVESQNCPLSPALIVLLALVVALLASILVLLIRARRELWWPGYPWWPGRYPLWMSRRIRHLKNRRK